MDKKELAGEGMHNSTHATALKRNMMDNVTTSRPCGALLHRIFCTSSSDSLVRGEIHVLLKERRYQKEWLL